MNDLPLLARVGSPVAVNPDSRLRAHAQAQGWDVLDLFSRIESTGD
jgi:phosphoserine phosphatase